MAATTNHQSFTQPSDPNVALWRYMDLSKFAALLQRSALTFARADQLGDPFEGSTPEPNAKMYQAVMAIRKVAPDKDAYAGMSDDAVKALFKHISDNKRQWVKRTFVSCWHMNEAESAAMWKLYSRSSDAVCVRTDYASLAAVLPDDAHMGVVTYIDFKTTGIPEGNLFTPFLMKRKSFAHEREARALMLDASHANLADVPPVQHIGVDLKALVKGAYVSPESPDWFRDVVAGLAKTYGLDVSVEHSEMNAIPLY